MCCMKQLNAGTAIIATLFIVSGAIYAGSWQASLSNSQEDWDGTYDSYDQDYNYQSCGDGMCDSDEDEYSCDIDCGTPCYTVDCAAPPEGCWYENPEFDRECQVSCGRMKCKEKEIEKFDCNPIVCEDGRGHPRCTPEGHPINYFVDPCFKSSAPEMCFYNDRKYEIGEKFKDADDCNTCYCDDGGNVSCTEMYCGGNDDSNTEYEEEVVTAPPVMNRFSDVTSQTLEGEAANALAEKGIIGGFPDGSFRGSQPVNRAEAAKFLLMSRLGVKNSALNNGRFTDVLEGEWYVKYIVTAADLGIIDGYKDGTFRPANTVNTAEFLKMLTGAFDLPQNIEHGFSDVPSDAWFARYAGGADAFNLFPGGSEGKLQPEKLLTRGEVSIAIYRILNAQ